MESLLSIEEVAERLGISTKTVRVMIDRDGLPAIHLGRQFRFRPRDLDRWLDALIVPETKKSWIAERGAA